MKKLLVTDVALKNIIYQSDLNESQKDKLLQLCLNYRRTNMNAVGFKTIYHACELMELDFEKIFDGFIFR